MKLVTYQLLDTSSLKTGILISRDEVLDIESECRVRGATNNTSTMIDIIKGASRR
jgi:hypothetical protein